MNNYLYKYFKFKKRFGQNFLMDNKVINKIINFINPKFDDNIFEIGAGSGCLTRALYNCVDKLSVIEIDNVLYNFLKKMFLKKNVNIFNENILKFDFKNFLKYNYPIRIVGNIPYNISIHIIFYCFNFLHKIQDMYFMVQYDVAKKMSALVGTKSYGKLSIFLQYYCSIKILFDVEAKSFFPSPNVNSCFIKLSPLKRSFNKYLNITHFKYIVSKAFSQRRKTLKNSLSKIFDKNDFIKLNIDYSLRAQNLNIIEYCKLSKYFSKNAFNKNLYIN
ncbi:16S rRNA (adenine(1518)-N(6)/adenine(1519)-N(6))-dimethyltransferase RsmA [Buchnera aphidicola (Chaitoregma tattakana)]|uniref:16S rRNA (adenine(1518)-N(6)/adenine(1519)-N(6))- dimethyltransferase RsmA n=1 Tax=Buchnera aphidicola TaxID=9 RepID=UPI0031B8B075